MDEQQRQQRHSSEPVIVVDRGGTPRINGTRLTVYDVLDYHKHGEHHTVIAALFGISSRQVLAAIDYIEEHKEEVWRDYEQILARHAKGNPPHVRAKLDESHRKVLARLEAIHGRRAQQGGHPDAKAAG